MLHVPEAQGSLPPGAHALYVRGVHLPASAVSCCTYRTAYCGTHPRFCLADTKLLQVMEAIWRNQTAACQELASPCSGPDRGACNLTADVCVCHPEWIGLQCENQPQAVVGGDSGLSKVDRQTDIQTYRQAGRQAGRQADRQLDR